VALGAVTVVDEDGPAARTLARTEVAMYLAVVAELDPTVQIEPDLIARVHDHRPGPPRAHTSPPGSACRHGGLAMPTHREGAPSPG
jgi:hypothetical protein